MKFYDVMQLNAANSKALICNTKDIKEKRKYQTAYLLKNALTSLFCVAFVGIYSALFGSENSIAGVVVLIAVLVFRFSDLGIQAEQGAVAIMGIFAVLAIGPHLSNMVSPGFRFGIDLLCIFIIVLFGCHNTIMSNQTTFVLGYLLLQGYDVSGAAYTMRVIGLLTGGALVSAIFYIDHRKIHYRRTIKDLLAEFNIRAIRTKWQVKFSIGIAGVMLIGNLMNIPRPMWTGIACMSLLQPFSDDVVFRAKRRAPFMIPGCILFLILYHFLPTEYMMCIGILGGFLGGFCATYQWQTVFNCLGALSTAVGLFGPVGAVILRVANNIIGTIYTLIFDKLFHKICDLILDEKRKEAMDGTY